MTHGEPPTNPSTVPVANCKHCGNLIEQTATGEWIHVSSASYFCHRGFDEPMNLAKPAEEAL